jgi:integrase
VNTQLATTDLLLQTESAAVELVTNSLTSEHSKRAYAKALKDFLDWRVDRPINRALVNEYRQTLTGSPASINLRMSAIRKLATKAADNGLLDQTIASGIKRVKGVAAHGVRAGNWLSKNQAQRMLTAPNIETLKGLRDRAILAVIIGGGLRRSEAAALTFGHIQQRDGRWVMVAITGKGNRVRSIPIPSWVKLAIDEWATAANLSQGLVFRAMNKGDAIKHESMTPQAIRDIVKYYGEQIGKPELAAHDLRRTFAKLAHKGGAGLDQIQLSLGHASIKTTERYLGVSQNLTDAPCDHLGLTLE